MSPCALGAGDPFEDPAAVQRLHDEVLSRIRPDARERARLESALQPLIDKANVVAEAFEAEGRPGFEPLVVGSIAKDTWLHGSADIDLFLMFAEDLPREHLEEAGLEAGNRILPRPVLRYAEHPYVHGRWDGFDADVVPAHRVQDAEAIRSAVDRTPFHNAWVLAALEERPALRDEIRLMKGWLKGVGCYGAETSVGAISGYLSEVLVIHHGGFAPALGWLAHLTLGARLDPSHDSDATFDHDPITIIDPVDRTRNAAGAVTEETVERLNAAARAYLAHPDVRFFDPLPLTPATGDDAIRALGDHGAVVCLWPIPAMREDARVPHLHRAAQNLGAHLMREGFRVVRSRGGVAGPCELTITASEAGDAIDAEHARDAAAAVRTGEAAEAADGDDVTEAASAGPTAASGVLPAPGVCLDGVAWLFVETDAVELEAVKTHVGPPPHIEDRAREFCSKWVDDPRVIEGPAVVKVHGKDRVYVKLTVEGRGLVERTRDVLERDVRLGKHIDQVRREHDATIAALPRALDHAAELVASTLRSGSDGHDVRRVVDVVAEDLVARLSELIATVPSWERTGDAAHDHAAPDRMAPTRLRDETA